MVKKSDVISIRLTLDTAKWVNEKAGGRGDVKPPRGAVSELIELALVEMRQGMEWKPPRKKRGPR